MRITTWHGGGGNTGGRWRPALTSATLHAAPRRAAPTPNPHARARTATHPHVVDAVRALRPELLVAREAGQVVRGARDAAKARLGRRPLAERAARVARRAQRGAAVLPRCARGGARRERRRRAARRRARRRCGRRRGRRLCGGRGEGRRGGDGRRWGGRAAGARCEGGAALLACARRGSPPCAAIRRRRGSRTIPNALPRRSGAGGGRWRRAGGPRRAHRPGVALWAPALSAGPTGSRPARSDGRAADRGVVLMLLDSGPDGLGSGPPGPGVAGVAGPVPAGSGARTPCSRLRGVASPLGVPLDQSMGAPCPAGGVRWGQRWAARSGVRVDGRGVTGVRHGAGPLRMAGSGPGGRHLAALPAFGVRCQLSAAAHPKAPRPGSPALSPPNQLRPRPDPRVVARSPSRAPPPAPRPRAPARRHGGGGRRRDGDDGLRRAGGHAAAHPAGGGAGAAGGAAPRVRSAVCSGARV
jgi:hypothetical protein